MPKRDKDRRSGRDQGRGPGPGGGSGPGDEDYDWIRYLAEGRSAAGAQAPAARTEALPQRTGRDASRPSGGATAGRGESVTATRARHGGRSAGVASLDSWPEDRAPGLVGERGARGAAGQAPHRSAGLDDYAAPLYPGQAGLVPPLPDRDEPWLDSDIWRQPLYPPDTGSLPPVREREPKPSGDVPASWGALARTVDEDLRTRGRPDRPAGPGQAADGGRPDWQSGTGVPSRPAGTARPVPEEFDQSARPGGAQAPWGDRPSRADRDELLRRGGSGSAGSDEPSWRGRPWAADQAADQDVQRRRGGSGSPGSGELPRRVPPGDAGSEPLPRRVRPGGAGGLDGPSVPGRGGAAGALPKRVSRDGAHRGDLTDPRRSSSSAWERPSASGDPSTLGSDDRSRRGGPQGLAGGGRPLRGGSGSVDTGPLSRPVRPDSSGWDELPRDASVAGLAPPRGASPADREPSGGGRPDAVGWGSADWDASDWDAPDWDYADWTDPNLGAGQPEAPAARGRRPAATSQQGRAGHSDASAPAPAGPDDTDGRGIAPAQPGRPAKRDWRSRLGLPDVSALTGSLSEAAGPQAPSRRGRRSRRTEPDLPARNDPPSHLAWPDNVPAGTRGRGDEPDSSFRLGPPDALARADLGDHPVGSGPARPGSPTQTGPHGFGGPDHDQDAARTGVPGRSGGSPFDLADAPGGTYLGSRPSGSDLGPDAAGTGPQRRHGKTDLGPDAAGTGPQRRHGRTDLDWPDAPGRPGSARRSGGPAFDGPDGLDRTGNRGRALGSGADLTDAPAGAGRSIRAGAPGTGGRAGIPEPWTPVRGALPVSADATQTIDSPERDLPAPARPAKKSPGKKRPGTGRPARRPAARPAGGGRQGGSARGPGKARTSAAASGPGRARGRGRRKALIIGGSALAVLLAVAAVFLLLPQPSHSITLPSAIGGYVRQPAQTSTSAEQFRHKIVAGASGEVKNVVAAVYQRSTGPGTTAGPQVVVFIGGNLAGGASAGSLIGAFSARLSGAFSTSPGSLGGQAACAPASTGGPAECAWADSDTFGVVISATLTASQLAAEMRAMRPQIERASR